jgi:hypothetical protein
MGFFKDGMTADEKNELQNKNLIIPATGDLWSSGMSMLETVFTTRNGVWVQGRDGSVVIQRYKSVHFSSEFAKQHNAEQIAAREEPLAEAQPSQNQQVQDKPLYKWTHEDLQEWMKLAIAHEGKMTRYHHKWFPFFFSFLLVMDL